MTRLPDILRRLDYRSFDVFTEGDYNLNIIAFRNSNTQPNRFDDRLAVAFKVGGRWEVRQWAVTTDPGFFWLANPMHVDGTAFLRTGQYRGSHKLGTHKTYAALVQAKPVTVYRDNNKDLALDSTGASTYTGMFGVNIHKAGQNSSQVDKWSAGCIVFQREKDFIELMGLANRSAELYGNSFTLTMLQDY